MEYYCSTCSGLSLEALRRPSGFPHLQNARDIVSSAAGCHLCNIIRLALLQDKTTQDADLKLESSLAPDPIVLYGMTTDGLYDEFPGPLVGIAVHVSSGDALDIANLSLLAPRDSPAVAREDIGGFPLLRNPGCVEGFDVLRGWLRTCRSSHPQCGHAFSNLDKKSSVPALPTRVLDVGREADSPRLCISNGLKAPYAALSHCWGKNKLLRTLKDNVHLHQQSIPLESLPKTFQDAVEITRQVGLRFLWIDSLWIVQDDKEDWRRESAVMGRIYQLAELTIAATGAVDGSKGCFIERLPPPAMPVALPDSRVNGEQQHIFIGLYPDAVDSTITPSPLGERAWITQEWMLSTRVIHFTAARMVWTCKDSILTEDGEVVAEAEEQLLNRRLEETLMNSRVSTTDTADEQLFVSRLPFYSSWCDFVSAYTCRKLTYESDRPVAMLGVAHVLQDALGGRYIAGLLCEKPDQDRDITFRSGSTWQQRLIMTQLFWFFKQEIARPRLGDGLSWRQRLLRLNKMTRPEVLRLQPSWSWLSTLGPVAHHVAPRSAQLIAKDIEIHYGRQGSHQPTADNAQSDSCYFLQLQAPLTVIEPESFRLIQDQFPLWAKSGGDFQYYYSRTSLLTGAMLLPGNMAFMVDKRGQPLGWASLDIGQAPQSKIYALALCTNYLDQKFDGYNVLYLEPVGDHIGTGSHPTCFKRLGMGEILDMSRFTDALVSVSIY